jgi:hypothetical protein
MARPKTAPKQAPKSGVAIALRVPEELAEAIDREIERLSKERPGAMIHRSDVVREILHRALMNEPKKGK